MGQFGPGKRLALEVAVAAPAGGPDGLGRFRHLFPTQLHSGWCEPTRSLIRIMLANRRALHPYWNYDFIDQESASKVNPLSDEANSKPRPSMPVAHTENDQMGANY